MSFLSIMMALGPGPERGQTETVKRSHDSLWSTPGLLNVLRKRENLLEE